MAARKPPSYGDLSRKTEEQRKAQDKRASSAEPEAKQAANPVAPFTSDDSVSVTHKSSRNIAPNNQNTAMVGLRITQEQKDGLRDLAMENRMNVNDYMRVVVAELLSGTYIPKGLKGRAQ